MAIHFRTMKWMHENDTDADKIHSFNVLIAFVLNVPELKNLGLEHEIICPTLWILRHSTTTSDGEWSVASVELDKSLHVHDVDFYGEAPGGGNIDNDGKTPFIIISSSSTGAGQKTTRTIATVDYNELSFTSLKKSPIFTKPGQGTANNGVESLVHSIIADPLFTSNCHRSNLQDVVKKTRDLHPGGWTSSGLAVSGTRGVACVFTSNNRFQLFDMEDDEEDDDEDDDDDEDQ
uniref:Uncharacterized protein n=1 Tax=Aplanochytrium stocchinoi TaxID=215587 RepID=A0A6S8D689_9STRA